MASVAVPSSRLLVALFGPTSSGKTRLSIELCLRLLPVIAPVVVSADSRQVYRHMDIGTSKTTSVEMRGIQHEMISVADPARKYELETYVSAAREHIERCWTNGRLPLIVGGTAVYVKALLEGWDVGGSASVRDALRRDFPRAMSEDAYRTLQRLDRSLANRVHPRNYDAVINALTAAVTRRAKDEREPPEPRIQTVVLGLDRPGRKVDTRVARTFDQQMDRGLFDEVRQLSSQYDLDQELRRRGKDSPNQVLHTHGYREFWEVAGERGKPVGSLTATDLSTVRDRAIEHICTYTRRQRSAFRKLLGLRMISTTEDAYRAVTDIDRW